MSNWKRFLVLGSLGLTLLAGLLFTASTSGSHAAFASGCNTTATGSWSNNCETSETEHNFSNFVVAIQTVVTYSNTGCSTNGIDGSFGPNTFAGVECFQRAKHLSSIDGIVGPQTWGALENVLICSGNPPHALLCHLPGKSTTVFTGANAGAGIWQVFFLPKNTWCTMNTSSPC